jgi:hypothetical protein
MGILLLIRRKGSEGMAGGTKQSTAAGRHTSTTTGLEKCNENAMFRR